MWRATISAQPVRSTTSSSSHPRTTCGAISCTRSLCRTRCAAETQSGKGETQMPKDLNSPKGRPLQSVASVPGDANCGNGAAALHILQSAANLCGFLVVAVVAPMSGGPSQCSKADSPQRLALTELARKAE